MFNTGFAPNQPLLQWSFARTANLPISPTFAWTRHHSKTTQSQPTVNNGVGTNQQTITSPSIFLYANNICLTHLLNRHYLIQVMQLTNFWQLHLLQTTSKYPIYVPNNRYSMQAQHNVIHIATPIWCQWCHNQPKA